MAKWRLVILGVPVLSVFKQELCLVARKRWIRRCFCVLGIIVVFGSVLIWLGLRHFLNSVVHSCTDAGSRDYLDQLVS